MRQFLNICTGLANTLQFLGDQGPPFSQRFLQCQVGKPGAHLDPGALGVDVAKRWIQPVTRRSADLGRNDFNLLSGFQWRIERNKLAVNARATAAVTQIGMDTITKIDRCRTLWQIDDFALRRDDVQGFIKCRLLVMIDPIRTVGDFVFPGQQLAQPGNFFVVIVFMRPLAALLVTPVRGNAEFSMLVHLVGANLDFQAAPVGTTHCRMQ